MSYPYQIKSFEDYQKAYNESIEKPEKFWASIAEHFYWHHKPKEILEWNFKEPNIKWFRDGKLNITENCLYRHLASLHNTPALIWEPNDPEEHHRVLTYNDLYTKVCQFANVLKNNEVKKGDRVCIYMGMIPELVIAILACARIGA
ncbi:MAG: AMP-binding protein, partial [Bacteroidota bacterium]|nr:AMP-binding protein [Bacteroidota bacterium]